ncbi:MAG: MarR family transcriptional regulator [Gammaproteobacteria bacterium]|nr:MAG: MarR family transcriptional regulator [Gammaproteobacteria bacterium]
MRKNIKFYGGETVNREKNESVGYLVTLASRKLLRNIETGLKPFNLTANQWAPLLALANERCNTVAGCARETGIDNGAMTRMLDRLEVKGFVSRKRSNNDRRVVNIALTSQGKKIAKDIPPVISEVLNQQLRGFSEKEFTLIKNLLQRFLINGETLAEQS